MKAFIIISVFTMVFEASAAPIKVRACESSNNENQIVFTTDLQNGNVHTRSRDKSGDWEDADFKMTVTNTLSFTSSDWSSTDILVLQSMGIGPFKTGTRYSGKLFHNTKSADTDVDVFDQNDGGWGVAISVGLNPLFIGSSTLCPDR